jgi:hypothetical protein
MRRVLYPELAKKKLGGTFSRSWENEKGTFLLKLGSGDNEEVQSLGAGLIGKWRGCILRSSGNEEDIVSRSWTKGKKWGGYNHLLSGHRKLKRVQTSGAGSSGKWGGYNQREERSSRELAWTDVGRVWLKADGLADAKCCQAVL